MKMQKKGQAALEFLMTYGWAILVVLVAVGALAFFGVLSPDQFLPSKCTLQSGIACLDHTASSTSLSVVIQNAQGYDMESITVSAENCGSSSSTSTLANGDQATYTIACNLTGSKYNADLNVSYTNTQTGLAHTNQGSIVAAIN